MAAKQRRYRGRREPGGRARRAYPSMAAKQKEPGPEFAKEAGRWLGWAQGDLTTARSNRADDKVPNRNAAYMAQQSAEKAIKAVVLLENKPFPEIHDIETVATLAPADFVNPASRTDLSWLSDLETTSRYPDEGDTVTTEDADRAVELADKVLAAARDHFVARGIDPTLFEAG